MYFCCRFDFYTVTTDDSKLRASFHGHNLSVAFLLVFSPWSSLIIVNFGVID